MKFEVNQPKIEQVTRRQLLEGRIARIEAYLERGDALPAGRKTKAAAERDSQYISKLAALTAELNAL